MFYLYTPLCLTRSFWLIDVTTSDKKHWWIQQFIFKKLILKSDIGDTRFRHFRYLKADVRNKEPNFSIIFFHNLICHIWMTLPFSFHAFHSWILSNLCNNFVLVFAWEEFDQNYAFLGGNIALHCILHKTHCADIYEILPLEML